MSAMMAFTLPCPFSAPEGKGSFFRLYIPPSFRAEVQLLQFTCSAFKGTTSISYHSSVQMIQIELLSCARCGPKLQQHADFSLKSKWHFTCPSAAVQSFSCVQLFVSSPMDCSMPSFPILHYLPEIAQSHVH